MKSLIVLLIVGVSACIAAPSGLLGGGLLGLGGLGGTTILGGGAIIGTPALGHAVLSAAPATIVQRTITTPGVIATGPILAAAPAVVAAPAVHAGPVATNALIAGPSGVIASAQANPGATVVGAPLGLGHIGLGH